MEEKFNPKIELPKANMYFIDVKGDDWDPTSEILYSVAAANCPACGIQNTDVERGVVRTCHGCGKNFDIGELDEKKSRTTS